MPVIGPVAPPQTGLPGFLTVLDLLDLCYADLGVTGTGQTLDANKATLGLRVLNQVVDGVDASRSMIYAVDRIVQPFTVGAYQYQIGTSNAPPPPTFGPTVIWKFRPTNIQTWAVLLGSIGGNPPLELAHTRTLTADEYDAGVTLKQLTSTFPTALFYNPTAPNGTLNFWPVPAQGGNSMVLYTPSIVPKFTALAQTIMLPEGWSEFLEMATVEQLAPKVGRSMPPECAKVLARSRSSIKARNGYWPELKIPFNKRAGGYNFLSDELV